MLPKSRRIPRELFKELLNSRKFLNSPHFTIKISPNTQTKVAVSVSKKVSKKAVDRNRTRRRVYALVSGFLPDLSSGFYLIIAKPGADKLKKEDFGRELAELIKKG